MSVLSVSTTTNTAYQVTGDTTGSLVIQTGATPTTALTIDGSQNMGLGVTPSAWNSDKAIQIGTSSNTSFFSSGDTSGSMNLGKNAYSIGSSPKYVGNGYATWYAQNSGQHQWYISPSNSSGAGASISFTQAMTLDASGNLVVGTTSAVQGGKLSVSASSRPLVSYVNSAGLSNEAGKFVKTDNNSTTSNVLLNFEINSGATGSGQINSNGANAAAFGSYSDARLKENIVNLPSQLENILALRPVEFDYIESEGGGHQIGFIAQEIQTVYSDSVGERADGMLTVTGWSKTEARLVKAMQEQNQLITSLTERITALEGAK